MSNTKHEKPPQVIDNPCWGGKNIDEHSLACLLSLIKAGYFDSKTSDNETTSDPTHHSILLHDDADYLVLNKPPDLRMDGPFPATVHKLVTLWNPPPSLLQLCNVPEGKIDDHDMQQVLMGAISKLTKHNDLKDNFIRGTHQLDYATSGVLLMAKSKVAAAAACKSFEDRVTKKEYLAIVHGNIRTDSMMLLNEKEEDTLKRWKSGDLEKSYRKGRNMFFRGSKEKTFVGFMPPHAVFQKWKSTRGRKKRKRQDYAKKNDTERFLLETTAVPQEMEEIALKSNWKDVKKERTLKEMFEKISSDYNSILRKDVLKEDVNVKDNGLKHDQSENSGFLPTTFKVKGDDQDTFYVHAALADQLDDFKVMVDPKALSGFPSETINQYSSNCSTGDEGPKMKYRPALTRCRVLSGHNWGPNFVSKVQLQPWTGRR